MTATEKKSIIKKIQKLLSLAGSENENEAELAAAAASKMITQHNLSTQEVEMDQSYENAEVVEKNRLSQEDKWVLPIIKAFFFVSPMICSRVAGYNNKTGNVRRTHTIKFVGEEVNVAVAKELYIFLVREYKILFTSYRIKTGCKLSSRDSYYDGLTFGLTKKLKEVRSATESETGLVVLEDPKLKDFVKELYPTAKKTTRKANLNDRKAQSQGVTDGKTINLNKNINS